MNVYDRQLENDGRILHHLGLMLQRDENGAARPVSSFFSDAHQAQAKHVASVQYAQPLDSGQGRSLPTSGNTPLTVRCAWCEAEEKQKFGKQKAEKGISHGICERHAAAMRAEIEQMHKEAA